MKNNLILTKDGSVFALYEVPSTILNSIDIIAKENYKGSLYATLKKVLPYNNFHIKTTPINQNLVEYFSLLSEDIDWDSPVGDLADSLLGAMIDHLENDLEEVFEHKEYLIIPLKSLEVTPDLKMSLKRGYETVRDKLMGFLGVSSEVPVDWYKRYEGASLELRSKLSFLNVRQLTTEQTYFLCWSQYRRGMSLSEQSQVELVKMSLEDIDDVNIEFENVTVMKLTDATQSSYVAFLPVDEVPQNISYLNLMEDVKSLPFPVESDVLVGFSKDKGPFSLFGKSKRVKKRLNNTIMEAYKSGSDQKTSVMTSRFLLSEMQERIDLKDPLVSYLHTFVVTGSSLASLHNRYERLMSVLSDIGVKLVRANADQLYLFYKTMIGNILTAEDKNFIQSMSLEAFCENLFFVNRVVGTNNGFYIGRVDPTTKNWAGDFEEILASSSRPVYTNLLQANKVGIEGKITDNPHVAIIGETGRGKSYLMKLLFTYHSLLKAKVLYIDPKAEMRKRYMKVLANLKEKGENEPLQRYIESINFCSLDSSKESNNGVLDPFGFLEDKYLKDLAESMIDSLIDENSNVIRDGYLTAIDQALERRRSGKKTGMLHIFEYMSQSGKEDVRLTAKLLKRVVSDSVLSLCFSDGTNDTISFDDKITILEITGLDVAKDVEAGDRNKLQQKSLNVLYVLGYFCRQFGARNPDEETIIFWDEVWSLLATSIGRSVLNEAKRVGRSFNNFLVLGTQSVHDLGEKGNSGTGFGTVFAFLEPREVSDVLEYMDVRDNETTNLWMKNMSPRQCVYCDTFGRKERIIVDGFDKDLGELFKTVDSKLKSVS